MSLALQLETEDQAKARCRVAVARTWEADEIARGDDRPGLHREHVFDLEEGIRVIAAREHSSELKLTILHASFSVQNAELAKQIGAEGFFNRCQELFREFFDRIPDKKAVVTRAGIVHLFCELEKDR